MIISFIIISLILLVLIIIGITIDKEEEAKAEADEEERIKAEAEAELEAVGMAMYIRSLFQDWWLNSRFNSFIVLEKRTPMNFNGKRYMAVRHTTTNECYNLEVDVTTYFNFDVGNEICLTNMEYDYITKEAIAEFTAKSGVDVSLELLQSAWGIEEIFQEFSSRHNRSFDEFTF